MPKWIVREYQRGLHYDKGRFTGVLEPGRYSWWRWQGQHIDVVDIRETSQTVEGQEILTSDKIGVRITLIAQFRVDDPVAARHKVDNYASQLYQDLQLTLRDAVTSQTLEDLLKSRDALSSGIQDEVAKRAREYGVELSRVGVKDIILPGSVRTVFLQEMEAELKGRANLVAARHELAAARAKANTAKMLRENPHLVRMQELEVLTSLASKSGNVIVIPGLENLFAKTSYEPSVPGPTTNGPAPSGETA
jgi:regulator of protease activity HflC (stomatin/prohibitin superfamily)